MTRPSTVDRLPVEIRDRIGQLRAEGHTIDEIMAALGELDAAKISRSALGRHIKNMDAMGRRLRQSREVSTALVRELGAEPASRVARMNIELLHASILELQLAISEGEALDSKQVMELSRSMLALTNASRHDVEFVKSIEERAAARVKEEFSEQLQANRKEMGLSAENAENIKAMLYGVAPVRKPQ